MSFQRSSGETHTPTSQAIVCHRTKFLMARGAGQTFVKQAKPPAYCFCNLASNTGCQPWRHV
eukprot:75378-Pleurochrysis_carterae.AAC.4